MSDPAPAPTFKEAVCAKFGCAPEQYVQTVFFHTLYDHARWPARLLLRFDPKFFRDDFDLIESLAPLKAYCPIRREINYFRELYRPHGPLRGDLHIRVSSAKLRALAQELLPVQRKHGG